MIPRRFLLRGLILLTLGLLATHPAGAQTALTATNGLVLWLRGDAGITTNASGAVTQWEDQSGQNNHAVQPDETAAPTLTPSALNNQPAVRFDGDNDYLDVATAPSIENVGDITSFFVVQFEDFANFRSIWGKTAANIPSSTDYYITPDRIPRAYRGSGSASDIGFVDSTVRPRAGDFLILGFDQTGTTLTHYLNADATGTGELTATLVDSATPLKVGSRDDLFTKMKGNIAELLIYDRALPATDRNNLVQYLQTKYGITNQSPTINLTAPANNSSVSAPGVVTVSATATDTDGTISRVDFFANGSLLASATSVPFQVPVLINTPGSITFTAVAIDNKDARGNATPITITATGTATSVLAVTNGLQLWLKADAGVTKDASNAVTEWADQSGQGNHATQPDPTLAPLATETGFAGEPSLHFDGNDDYLNVVHSPSLAITGDIASFFAVRFDDFGTFRSVWGKTAGNVPRPNDYYLLPGSGIPRVFRGSDETGVNQFVDGAGGVPTNSPSLLGFNQVGTLMTHHFNGQPFGSGQLTVVPTDASADLKIGTRDDFVTRFHGDMAELLIYNRGLSEEEAFAVNAYLGGRYGVAIVQATNNPPVVTLTAPASGATVNVPTNVTVTATATDTDGGISRVDFFADGAYIGSDSTAPYQVTANLGLAGNVAISAEAVDNLGAAASSSTVTITAQGGSSIPLPATAALKVWLKADSGITADSTGAVTNWTDSSGQGNNATQSNAAQAPILVNDSLNELPAVSFDGEDDFLQVASKASLDLTRDLTSFFVLRVDDFETFRAVWTKTEGNQPRPIDYYVLPETGLPRAIRGGPAGLGSVDGTQALTAGEFAIVGFELDGNTLTHYLADQATGTGTVAASGFDAGTPLMIGTRADFGTRLRGAIAELIIYGGALSDADRNQVVSYLRNRFFATNGGPTPVTVRRSGANVVLEWTGTARLQEAPNITGPWTDAANATSPFTVTPSDQQKFYRVIN